MNEEEYLEARSRDVCPICGDGDICLLHLNNSRRSSEEVERTHRCYMCGSEWTDYFTISSVVITYEGDGWDEDEEDEEEEDEEDEYLYDETLSPSEVYSSLVRAIKDGFAGGVRSVEQMKQTTLFDVKQPH